MIALKLRFSSKQSYIFVNPAEHFRLAFMDLSNPVVQKLAFDPSLPLQFFAKLPMTRRLQLR
jgi:hypothetical protein